ncbi:MAG: OmpA family protein [Bacteroidetes bacterium]|nr:OmpA family protein [Bacteroidota bacterium]
MKKIIFYCLIFTSLATFKTNAQTQYNQFALGAQVGTAFSHADGDVGTPGYHLGFTGKYSLNNRFALRGTLATTGVKTNIKYSNSKNTASSSVYESNFQFVFNAVNFRSNKLDNTGINPINANVYFGLGYGIHYDNIDFTERPLGSKTSNTGGYFALSFGYKQMLSNVIDFFVEYGLRVTDNDYLDGFNPLTPTNRSNDYFSILSAGLCFNLGQGSKNIEWTDSYDEMFQKLSDNKKKKSEHSDEYKNIKAKLDSTNKKLELLDLLLTDTDNDGVSDFVDQEADSKTAEVDVHGVQLDTDKDGVADYKDNCHLVAAKTNNGCPEVKFQMTNETKIAIKQIVKGILFEPSKANIKSESYDDLDKLANILNENKAARLTIEGHTDNLGDTEKNLLLSQQRADAVLNYLIEKGIDKTKVFAVGYGDTKPISPNTTPKGRAKNRRVDLVLY